MSSKIDSFAQSAFSFGYRRPLRLSRLHVFDEALRRREIVYQYSVFSNVDKSILYEWLSPMRQYGKITNSLYVIRQNYTLVYWYITCGCWLCVIICHALFLRVICSLREQPLRYYDYGTTLVDRAAHIRHITYVFATLAINSNSFMVTNRYVSIFLSNINATAF